ncbi:MAG: NAD-dependent epimerase/dehydratase family protein [Thermoplasmata archaeon]|nr:NAD-dependent epimerase/dehydratase family protein [Thermoplasmata archaeon]
MKEHGSGDGSLKSLLVIGGSGFVGRNIIPELMEKYSVSYMSRSECKKLKDLGVPWIKGDIRNEEDLKIIRDFDIIMDLVAVINEKMEKHHDVNVIGMHNIISIAREDSRIVYFSAMNSDRGRTRYFITKYQAENMLMKRGNYTILRPSIIFGEDDYLTNMLRNLKVPFVPRSGWLCPVYVKDIAKILPRLIDDGGIFEISGPEELSLLDMYNIIREINGKKRAHSVPDFLVYPFLPFLPITREQLEMLKMDFCHGKDIWKKYSMEPSKYRETMEKLLKK